MTRRSLIDRFWVVQIIWRPPLINGCNLWIGEFLYFPLFTPEFEDDPIFELQYSNLSFWDSFPLTELFKYRNSGSACSSCLITCLPQTIFPTNAVFAITLPTSQQKRVRTFSLPTRLILLDRSRSILCPTNMILGASPIYLAASLGHSSVVFRWPK